MSTAWAEYDCARAGFLFCASDRHEGKQSSLSVFDLDTAAIPGVKHDGRNENIADVEGRSKGSGKTDGEKFIRTIHRDDGFGSAAGRFEADAGADHDRVIEFEKSIGATGVVAADTSRGFCEIGNFAFEGGDDRKLRHSR